MINALKVTITFMENGVLASRSVLEAISFLIRLSENHTELHHF